ncbi:MAG: GNAT family N-acetyltransferase [Casimicrobium sp.]
MRSRETLFEFLEADELRHITPSRMLTMYGDALTAFPIDAVDERGFVFVMPRAVSQWATLKYPNAIHCVYVALPPVASEALIDSATDCVLRETHDEPFAIITLEHRLIERLQKRGDARMPMRYALALLTFTPHVVMNDADDIDCESRVLDARVRNACTSLVADDALPLLRAHNVYSDRELHTMFDDGSARCWLRYVNDEAVAVLLTFANSKTLHEIGSLYVLPSARRAGHAQALVRAALRHIASRGLKVRYVVDATNDASIALAQQSGLREALRSAHWQTAGSV